ncbi:MAG: hypothetical protein ABIS29_03155 [Vicinamibacterales bacterium]
MRFMMIVKTSDIHDIRSRQRRDDLVRRIARTARRAAPAHATIGST